MKIKVANKILYNGLAVNADLTEKAKTAALNSISLLSIFIMSCMIVFDGLKNNLFVAAVLGVVVILVIISLIIVGSTKKSIIGRVFISYLAFLLFTFLNYTTEIDRSAYYWIYLYPLLSIFFLGIIHGTILTLLFGAVTSLILFKYTGVNDLPVSIDVSARAIGAYIGASAFTIAFELIRLQTFNELKSTSNALVLRRKQTEMILDNVKQGIFLLDKDLNLENERSKYFNELFKGIKEKHSFLDLIKNKLPERDFVATKDYLELFFNKTVNPTLLSSINPVDKVLMNFPKDNGDIEHTWLEFDFERVVLKGGEVQILGLFRNVTERVLLEEQLVREETESTKNMESLFQIIHVDPKLMDEFIKDTDDEIMKINDLLKVETDDTESVINHIFSLVHSIKGNAQLLGLSSIAAKLLDFENYIKELKEANPTWRELLQLTVNLAELKHDVNGIKELIEKVISFQNQMGDISQNRKYIMEQGIKKAISRLVDDTDKIIDVDLEHYDIEEVPEKYRRLFKDSITQLIRNSVAHGIETSEERINKNKDPKGTISLSLKKSDKNIEFIFRDDGRGLSIDKIKEAAITKKGFSSEQVKKLSSSDAVKLIFHPGFTTQNEVDNIAGQGIGMNVVKNHVDNAGGKLNIKSSVGNFCEFKILLPV